MRRLKLRQEKGQATLEFAFALLFFAAFLMVLGDMIHICYEWTCLQYASQEGARYGSLGLKNTSETNRENMIRNRVIQTASQLGVTDVNVELVDQNDETTAGLPFSYLLIRATKTIELNAVNQFLVKLLENLGFVTRDDPNGYPTSYPVTVVAAVQNEPFNIAEQIPS